MSFDSALRDDIDLPAGRRTVEVLLSVMFACRRNPRLSETPEFDFWRIGTKIGMNVRVVRTV